MEVIARISYHNPVITLSFHRKQAGDKNATSYTIHILYTKTQTRNNW